MQNQSNHEMTSLYYATIITKTTSSFGYFLVADFRYGALSVNNHPTGVHPFNASQGDSITDQYYMGGNCE